MRQLEIKNRAKELRKSGMTHREIKKELDISLGSASLWTKGISVTQEQRISIYKRRSGFSKEGRLSVMMAQKNRLHKRKCTGDDLLRQIQLFYRDRGRIPLKHEFNDYRIFKHYFGTWNHAIRLAGFKPNKTLFSKKFTAKDGHVCDSYTEMILDDYFTEHSVSHEIHVSYPGNPKFKVDFIINGLFVEFFGLAGELKAYDKLVSRKRKLCRQEKISLVEIYPKDIYKKNGLKNILEKILCPVT